MDLEALKKLVEKLKGLNWFIMSGGAVEVYTRGERKAGDIDLALKGKDIDLFAKRLGSKASNRIIDKKSFLVKDYGFISEIDGQQIEATNGYPSVRVEQNNFNKLFDSKVNINYLGCKIFVVPIEELIVQKAFMGRDKDVADLNLLVKMEYRWEKIVEYATDWGDEKRIIDILKELGYNS